MPTPMTYFQFDEVVGLRGLLALPDVHLDQVRLLQREISPRRNVGESVYDFRTLLKARLDSLSLPILASADSVIFIFGWMSIKTGKILSEPKLAGMISLQIMPNAGFTSSIVTDLIIAKPYRGQNLSRRFTDRAKQIDMAVRATRSNAIHSIKRGNAFREAYIRAGFEDSPIRILERRYRHEG